MIMNNIAQVVSDFFFHRQAFQQSLLAHAQLQEGRGQPRALRYSGHNSWSRGVGVPLYKIHHKKSYIESEFLDFYFNTNNSINKVVYYNNSRNTAILFSTELQQKVFINMGSKLTTFFSISSLRGYAVSATAALLEYDSVKLVHIHNKKIGIMNRLVQLLIVGYIVG